MQMLPVKHICTKIIVHLHTVKISVCNTLQVFLFLLNTTRNAGDVKTLYISSLMPFFLNLCSEPLSVILLNYKK